MRPATPLALALALLAAPALAAAPDDTPPVGPAPVAGCSIGPQLVRAREGELASAQSAVTADLAQVQADYAAVQKGLTEALLAKRHAITATNAAASYDAPGGAAEQGYLYAAMQDEDQAVAALRQSDAALKTAARDRLALDGAESALLQLMGCAPPAE